MLNFALLLILVGVLTFFFGMIAEQISQIRKQTLVAEDLGSMSKQMNADLRQNRVLDL